MRNFDPWLRPLGGIVALVLLVGGILPGTTAAPAGAQVLDDMPRCEGRGCEGKERVAPNQPIMSPEIGMDLGSFWKIIQETRAGARDDEHFLRRIIPRLKKMSPDELMKFEALRNWMRKRTPGRCGEQLIS